MINEWRKKLSKFEKQVLQKIYDEWRETGEWPKTLPLAIELRKEGSLYKMGEELSSAFINVGPPGAKNHHSQLSVLGISLCKDSKDELDLFMNILKYAINRYINNPEGDEITSKELKKELSLTEIEIKKSQDLIFGQSPPWFSGGQSLTSIDFNFSVSYQILEFEGTASFKDYVDRIDKKWLPNRFGGEREELQSQRYHQESDEYDQELSEYSPPNVDFMTDAQLASVVQNDLKELHDVMGFGAWKSASILSAIIAESLLLDFFMNDEQLAQRIFRNKWPNQVTLFDLAKGASSAGLISEPEQAIFGILRLYRNQIHPNRARIDKRPDEFIATALYAFVYKIINDMSEKRSS